MFGFSWPEFLATFGVIFLSELPDKTAVASLVLATKYKAREVIIGVWAAFLIQTFVAAAAGGLLHLFPEKAIHLVAGFGFLIFAFIAFKENLRKEIKEEEKIIKEESRLYKSGILASFMTIFVSEWGDLSQLATAALIGHSHTPLSVGAGALLALWSVTLIAVFSGHKLSKVLPKQKLNLLSGALFAVIGLIIIVSTVIS